MNKLESNNELIAELNELRLQLEEANDTIEAIRSGMVDTLIVKQNDGHQLFTLKNADNTYRIFIEQMAEGAVTLNADGNILYCNSQFALMSQMPLEKVVGQLLCNFFISEDSDYCNEMISAAWTTDVKGELRLLNQSGKVVPVLLSLKKLDLDEGLSMCIIITDLTSQKETQELLQLRNRQLEKSQDLAHQLNLNLEQIVKKRTEQLEANILEKTKIEEDLRSNQERLTRILETMGEGVGIVDVKGKLIYANTMAQKILGLSSTEMIDQSFYNMKWKNLRLDGTPLPHQEHPMAIMMNTGEAVYDHEIAMQPVNNELFYISINAAPLHDKNGILIGGVGTFMDVTVRRKMTQQKDDFISVASHELKTPLTSLKAYMQILTRLITTGAGSEKIPDFINKANSSLTRVLHLTEDLMNVSKLHKGHLPLNKTLFTMADLAGECCEQIKMTSSHLPVIEGDDHLKVFADYFRIDQVLINLISNAVKYAPDSKKIELYIEEQDGMAKISVKDSGIGIEAEKLPHLFDRYYRADVTDFKFSGLGLGLYISAQIIERHGGKMGVESTMGSGSSFWFTLPLN